MARHRDKGGLGSRQAILRRIAVLAIIWISFAFGHIYIGTIGTEGALQTMIRGRVSVEWARQHHDLWYEEIVGQQERPSPARSLDST
jgi:formate dehydrogenase subunit gamma